MASWLGKVAARAREAAASVQPAQGQRPVEDLAAELEQQARSVGERPSAAPQAAGDLLARWLEQSGSGGSGGFLLLALADPSSPSSTAGGERVPLGFREALLRSRAFELLLDACSRAQPLRTALQRRGNDGPSQLGQALGQVAEQILLPGALRLWPGLLEALLADGGARSCQDAGQSGGGGGHSGGKSKKGPGSLRWEQWARRVLGALKRGWQSEALPRVLNHLDHRLSDLAAGRQGGEKADQTGAPAGADDILRHGSGGARLSKQGIRAALARERLRTHAGEAATLRLRSDLLCGACARLVAIVSGGEARAPKIERLLADADDALLSLDEGVKAKHAEQESLSGSLGELGGELQRQITGIQMTRQAFAEKRGTLQDERKAVLRRLEELDVHLAQLEQEENSCANQEKKLQEQLQGTTAHYEKMIASAVQEQKALADEKLRGVGYKECAHMALDVVREHARGRGVEMAEQLRRRRSELHRTLAQYFKVERLRIEVAGECLEAAPLPPPKSSGTGAAGGGGAAGGEAPEAEVAAGEAWQAAQRLLRRVEAALGSLTAEGAPASDTPNEGPDSVAEVGAGPAEDEAGEGGQPAAAQEEDSVRRPEDVREVFEQAGGECVDCGAAEPIWASVSHGTCLCTECAGSHRGLGVHLSFVRSTTMDRWSSGQLRRMQLGGNAKFKEFLAGYPKLPGPGSTSEELLALYSSKAAAFYRRRLSSLCDGRSAAQQEQPPPAEEGHLLAGQEAGDASLASTAAASSEDGSAANAEDDAGGTFSQELQALKAAHADFCHRLEQRRASGGGGAAAACLSEST